MKPYLRWFATITFLLAIGFISPWGVQARDTFDVPVRIVQAWFALDQLGSNNFDGYGIRNFYNDTRGAGSSLEVLSIRTAQKISGFSVWRHRGPHSKYSMNWTEKEHRFGHYNHRFVRWATDNFIPGYNWGGQYIIPLLQPIYDKHLKRLARIFWIAYRIIQPRIDSVGAKYDRWTKVKNYGLQRAISFKDGGKDYRPSDYLVPGSDVYWKENQMQVSAAFWARRYIDGSFGLFAEGLRRLLKTYDPQFWDIDLGYLSRGVRVETHWN